MEPLTPNTITTFSEFLRALSLFAYGYGVDEEECEIGACCLAAPVKIIGENSGISQRFRGCGAVWTGETARPGERASEDQSRIV